MQELVRIKTSHPRLVPPPPQFPNREGRVAGERFEQTALFRGPSPGHPEGGEVSAHSEALAHDHQKASGRQGLRFRQLVGGGVFRAGKGGGSEEAQDIAARGLVALLGPPSQG